MPTKTKPSKRNFTRSTSKRDVYQEITNKIIDSLENGVAPWQRGWKVNALPMNLKTKKAYSGINHFLLYVIVEMNGFDSPYWLTLKQANDMGGRIIRGSKGAQIVKWNVYYKHKENGEIVWEKQWKDNRSKYNAEDYDRRITPRFFTVFNTEQTEGLENKVPKMEVNENDPIEACEKVVAGYKNCFPVTILMALCYVRPHGIILNSTARNYQNAYSPAS